MAQIIQNVQVRFKKSSQNLVVFSFKLLSGLILGLVLAIAGEQLMSYGNFGFWFVTVLFTGVFIKVSRSWSFGGLMVYNLVFVLFGLLLRMYVLIAPGH